MDPEAVFALTGPPVLLGWAILVLGPRRPAWARALPGLVLPMGLSGLYAVLVLAHFAAAEGDFGSLAGVRGLFASDWVLLAGWVHYLAFDMLIGQHLAQRMDSQGLSRLVQAPLLILTFLFGPLGYGLATLTLLILQPRSHV